MGFKGNALKGDPDNPLSPATQARALVEQVGFADAQYLIEDARAEIEGVSEIPVNIKPPLPLERAGDVTAILNGQWLIKSVIPAWALVGLYGHSGAGKTFVATDIVAAIVSGLDWNGCRVKRGLVLCVVAEGQSGFRNRLAGMLQAGRISKHDPLVFVAAPLDLFSPDGDVEALIATCRIAAENEGFPLAMVVVDTLSKTFGPGRENTDDMAGYVGHLQHISSKLRCTVMVVHHRPKSEESRDLRGHSSLRAGIDTAILVEGGDVRTATIVKQKDGEEGGVWRFVLDQVVLGVDEDGDEVTTCLVRYLNRQSSGELDKIEQASADNALFLTCLRERNRQRRAVSEKRSATYAPTEFATMAESKKIGKVRLEQAMDRLFRTGKIERAELWKDDYRKPVFGLREVDANGIQNSAANGAVSTVRATRPTVDKSVEKRAGDAANTHTPSYGRDDPAPSGAGGPSDWNPDGL